VDYSQYPKLEFRRKFWKIFGAEIGVVDPVSKATVGFIKMKAWKLREDVRLYTDKTLGQEVIRIKARQIIDFAATYDVVDSGTDQPICSLRRRGLKSTFVRDHWDILDAGGAVIGSVEETSGVLALLRRWLAILVGDIADVIFSVVQQTYDITTLSGGYNCSSQKPVCRQNDTRYQHGYSQARPTHQHRGHCHAQYHRRLQE
jgi:hypothetical protein